MADRAATQGVTPLEVMLAAMRHHHAAGALDAAAEIARHAAPYVHPRLGSVVHKGDPANPIPITFVELADAPAADPESDPA